MQSVEDTLYSSSPPSSAGTYQRRFSDASAVLPVEHFRHRRDSSSEDSSYTFGKPQGQYLSYASTPGLSRAPSFLDDGRLTVMSNYADVEIDETDDPAVARSMFQRPPRQTPSLPSLPSSTRIAADPHSIQSRSPSLTSGSSLSLRSPPLPSSISPVSPLTVSPVAMPRPTLAPRQIPLPYTCVFRMSQDGSMVLAPPDMSTDLSPLYRFEVHPNVFTPSSYTTKIYRGNSIFIGQFECVMCFAASLHL